MLTSVLGTAPAAVERCAAIEEELYQSQVGGHRAGGCAVCGAAGIDRSGCSAFVALFTLSGLMYDISYIDRYRDGCDLYEPSCMMDIDRYRDESVYINHV